MSRTDGTHRQTKVGCTACGNYEAHAPLCPNRSKPMTRAEAQAEAVRRWGEEGVAFCVRGSSRRGGKGTYYVGTGKPYTGSMVVKGCADSYKAAFADADTRAARPAGGGTNG